MFTEITKILDNFLMENGFELSTRCELDFAYYYAESVVAYSLITTERTDRLFTEFARVNGLTYDCGIFLLSFFHEIGHDQTIDEVSPNMEKKCSQVKAILREDSEEDCLKYFDVYDEKLATLWAIDYLNSNREKIAELAEKLREALDNF